MNLSKYSELLTLTANIGVVVGIVFLGVEIRQNTNMMQAQTRDSITEKTLGSLALTADNKYAADILWRGSNGEIEPSSGPDWVSFATLVRSYFTMYENESYQYDQGLFTEEEFAARLSTWRTNLQRVGFRNAWTRYRGTYSASFVERMDLLVEEL